MSVFEELRDQWKVFVTEYVQDLDAVRAATEAGYAHPASAASKLKEKPQIKQAIQELMRPVLEENLLTAENILAQLSGFLFSNIFKYVDEDGSLKVPICDLPEHLQQAIQSYETTEEGRLKVKLVNKVDCLNLAMKYRKLLGPEVQNNNTFMSVEQVKNFWNGVEQRTLDGQQQPTIEQRMALLASNPNAAKVAQPSSTAQPAAAGTLSTPEGTGT